jgi:hypothetical protein
VLSRCRNLFAGLPSRQLSHQLNAAGTERGA